MDNRTARWMQIVGMDRDDLAGLHAREKSQATRLPAFGNRPRFHVKGLGTWEANEKINLTTSRLLPDGYWPKGMDESSRQNSIRAFESAIYPFWASIEKQDTEREAALTSAQVAAPGQVLYECATVHRQDLAIHASGIKPNRDNSDQERMEMLRRRDARSRAS